MLVSCLCEVAPLLLAVLGGTYPYLDTSFLQHRAAMAEFLPFQPLVYETSLSLAPLNATTDRKLRDPVAIS